MVEGKISILCEGMRNKQTIKEQIGGSQGEFKELVKRHVWIEWKF